MTDGPTNERNGVEACLANVEFRDALKYNSTDKDMIKKWLLDLHITFDNDQQRDRVVEQIGKIKWSELESLENLLYGRQLDPIVG
jgi:hypothetical protein